MAKASKPLEEGAASFAWKAPNATDIASVAASSVSESASHQLGQLRDQMHQVHSFEAAACTPQSAWLLRPTWPAGFAWAFQINSVFLHFRGERQVVSRASTYKRQTAACSTAGRGQSSIHPFQTKLLPSSQMTELCALGDLEKLPRDIVVKVLSGLAPAELAVAEGTCQSVRGLGERVDRHCVLGARSSSPASYLPSWRRFDAPAVQLSTIFCGNDYVRWRIVQSHQASPAWFHR